MASLNERFRDTTKELTGSNVLALRTISGEGIGSTSITVPDQDLSVAPLSFTTAESEGFLITYVYIDFQTPITETCQIWRTTTGDDMLLETALLIGEQRVRFVPSTPEFIDVDNSEQFKITCSNANTTGVAKTTLKIEAV